MRRLDYIFVSHSDKDHVSGIYELIELCDNTFEIGTIVLPDISGGKGDASMDELALTAKEAGIDVKYAIAGDSVRAGGNAGRVDMAEKAGGTAEKTETGLDRIFLLGRYENISPKNGEMVSQTLKVLYLEMLETNPNPIQEPYEVWHQQMAGMAVGKYPKRLLAHRP